MTGEERETLLAAREMVAVIATEQPDGPPHLTPIWFSWDGSEFEIVTPEDSRKLRNLVRTGRGTLAVDKRTWPYQSVIAECELGVRRPIRGYPVALVHRYLDGELAATFLDTYRDSPLTAVRLRPTRWYGHINRG